VSAVYGSGFWATAVTVLLCSALPRVVAGTMSAGKALTQVFLCALAWPFWLAATIHEALDL